jgi:hypothetical protein
MQPTEIRSSSRHPTILIVIITLTTIVLTIIVIIIIIDTIITIITLITIVITGIGTTTTRIVTVGGDRMVGAVAGGSGNGERLAVTDWLPLAPVHDGSGK